MSNTPRTDVSAFNILDANDEYSRQHVYCSDGEYVESNFARQLEIENAALKNKLAKEPMESADREQNRLDYVLLAIRSTDKIKELERQIECMRPVVEAAVRWAHDRVTQTDDYYANEALDAVVREYQKGGMT